MNYFVRFVNLFQLAELCPLEWRYDLLYFTLHFIDEFQSFFNLVLQYLQLSFFFCTFLLFFFDLVQKYGQSHIGNLICNYILTWFNDSSLDIFPQFIYSFFPRSHQFKRLMEFKMCVFMQFVLDIHLLWHFALDLVKNLQIFLEIFKRNQLHFVV